MDLPSVLHDRFRAYFGSSDSSENVADLVGKVVIVTGGKGIGFSMVQKFARRGAKVYLAARNKDRAVEAIARLQAEGLAPGNGEVRWRELDLALPPEVKKSADTFLKEEERLDILVNSAGRLVSPYVLGYGDIEESMLVNHICPFVFTKALLPLMVETARLRGADVRIIVVTSIAMNILNDHRVRFRTVDDVNKSYVGVTYPGGWPKDGMMRYAQSKLVNALYAKQLQKTLDAVHVPITVMAVHPGYVWTEGLADAPLNKVRVVVPLFAAFFKLTFLSMADGARTPVFAATSPLVATRMDEYKGAYVVPFGRVGTPPHPQAEDAELAKELWDTTEGIIRSWGL